MQSEINRRSIFGLAAALVVPSVRIATANAAGVGDFDAYLRPYVETRNFGGAVVVAKAGRPIFRKAYGFASIDGKRPNSLATRFHVASLSSQFTAAAAMRLVDQGRLRLDAPVKDVLPDFPHGESITLRHLLSERSGLPDANDLPDYDEILQRRQTPASLVRLIAGKPLLFEPGSKRLHEEHSAYNLLALIIEKATGLPFREAIRREVFVPAGMHNSGIDDDGATEGELAIGYAPLRLTEVEPARTIKWSAKTGNGSAYSTVGDELKWIDAFFGDRVVSHSSRETMLDLSKGRAGYGWFKNVSQRFGVPIYYLNGRSPGFAAFLLHIPSEALSVVVLSNIYASVTTDIGLDLATIALGKPYEPLLLAHTKFGPADASAITGSYRFGPDFYVPNANVTLSIADGDLYMTYPKGDPIGLLPTASDRFVDRSYWQVVTLMRDPQGRVHSISYDRFTGSRVS